VGQNDQVNVGQKKLLCRMRPATVRGAGRPKPSPGGAPNGGTRTRAAACRRSPSFQWMLPSFPINTWPTVYTMPAPVQLGSCHPTLSPGTARPGHKTGCAVLAGGLEVRLRHSPISATQAGLKPEYVLYFCFFSHNFYF
jgi:hypothetical protein